MSLKITKAGILDTMQDLGRWGHQHLGINPGGAVDRFSASLGNALLGKALNAPVIELHFPASEILFAETCVVCVSGADFSPAVNGAPVPLHQPLFIPAGSVLNFKQRRSGARCYLSLLNEWTLDKWLGAYGTNLKAGVGGYKGRRFMKGDALEYETLPLPNNNSVHPLPWHYNKPSGNNGSIDFVLGNEWDWLTTKSQTDFLNNAFAILPASDRMGYRLSGEALEQQHDKQLISSAVNFGTIQLLPNGQLIVLMADHQTTGGYPRIGHVINTHLPKLAQMNVGEKVKFSMTTIAEAEDKFVKQQSFLAQLQSTCGFKIKSWLNAQGA